MYSSSRNPKIGMSVLLRDKGLIHTSTDHISAIILFIWFHVMAPETTFTDLSVGAPLSRSSLIQGLVLPLDDDVEGRESLGLASSHKSCGWGPPPLPFPPLLAPRPSLPPLLSFPRGGGRLCYSWRD
ncbi:hypothetical protein L195_g012351 [Trifolium pratense]|uniref:Uncharacterized protein n=1 Tax=Trifolium pratense TaxID=57577 RepID=A0A2K3PK48_TRIPR|nr:hypothetical protein L195_g012351 [Trifolium pratense]